MLGGWQTLASKCSNSIVSRIAELQLESNTDPTQRGAPAKDASAIFAECAKRQMLTI